MIAIDLGHGTNQDKGALGILSEEEIINNVGILVINKLKRLNNIVLETRPNFTTSVRDSLFYRCDKANKNNVDFFCSLHANAFNSIANGVEVWTYKRQNIPEALRFLEKMSKIGFRNRGIKDGLNEKQLYVINNTKARAMLCEICFCDNKNDIELYKNNIEKIANAIVYAITNINLDSNNNTSNNNNIDFTFNLYAHIQNMDDIKINGKNSIMIGTTGKDLRLEALSINASDNIDFNYAVNDQNNFWKGPKGQILGSRGRSKALYDFEIELLKIEKGYELQYRAHFQNTGWTNFITKGKCGNKNDKLRLEAIELKVVKKE